MRNRILVGALCTLGAAALALALSGTSVSAQDPPCDFMTGGGYIFRSGGAKATFGVGGGCKDGSLFGHLEYQDHGNNLNVHWISITGYLKQGVDGVDSNGQPTGTRTICGTATTNLFENVQFAVTAKDIGEPGNNDLFSIRLTDDSGGTLFYSTEADADHTLGGPGPGGGNIQLQKPGSSTIGFGGPCPAQGGAPPPFPE
jgi:hypothetical protein